MPTLKCGKLPAKHDPKGRTIKFKSILNEPALPPLPDEYEFAKQYPQFDLSPKMWGNGPDPEAETEEGFGDCEEVASYAQQREFEVIEQGKVIEVDVKQLVAQYKKESNGDNGLCMLDHNKIWKNEGIPIGYGKKILCKKRPLMYKIDAFARIDPTNEKEIQYATFLLGCNIGVAMPNSFQDEFSSGKPWEDISLEPNPYNGHAMKVVGWVIINGKLYFILWTWGKLQLAWVGWVRKFADEAWAIIDKIDDWLPNSPLDSDKLRGFLEAIPKM